MSDSYSAPSNCLLCKFSSKSNKILILGLFMPKFWFQGSLSYWPKFLRPNVTCCFCFLLVTPGYLVVISGYLVVNTGYFLLLPVTSDYFWLLLVPRFSNNVCNHMCTLSCSF